MSLTVEKVAEVLALPENDRSFLAHQLIASLDHLQDADAAALWTDEIERRSREMAAGHIDARSEEEMLQAIRLKLDAASHPAS